MEALFPISHLELLFGLDLKVRRKTEDLEEIAFSIGRNFSFLYKHQMDKTFM